MSRKEIKELIELRFGGVAKNLADALHMHESSVSRWLEEEKDESKRNPSGAATTLMRHWLEESRKQSARAS